MRARATWLMYRLLTDVVISKYRTLIRSPLFDVKLCARPKIRQFMLRRRGKRRRKKTERSSRLCNSLSYSSCLRIRVISPANSRRDVARIRGIILRRGTLRESILDYIVSRRKKSHSEPHCICSVKMEDVLSYIRHTIMQLLSFSLLALGLM